MALSEDLKAISDEITDAATAVGLGFLDKIAHRAEKNVNGSKNGEMTAETEVDKAIEVVKDVRKAVKEVNMILDTSIGALRAIAELKNNNKLRSWRGSEAVRLAKEALEKIDGENETDAG